MGAAFVACGVLQRVPLQMARFAQIETYRQVFIVPGSSVSEQDVQLDKNMRVMLGPRNWQTLKDLYGLETLRDEFVSEKIYIRGLLEFLVYVDPFDHEAFTIEGMGRFFLVRARTAGILLSGDFYVPTQRFDREELHTGCLPDAASSGGCVLVEVELFQTRYPNELTYLYDAPLAYAMWVDDSHRSDGYYSLDYSRPHEVYVDVDRDRTLSAEEMIGHLLLRPPRQERLTKLFDFRGTEFLRSYP